MSCTKINLERWPQHPHAQGVNLDVQLGSGAQAPDLGSVTLAGVLHGSCTQGSVLPLPGAVTGKSCALQQGL